MLHTIASLLDIVANRSRGAEKILDMGRANLEVAPVGFRKLSEGKEISGCFQLPFMGSELPFMGSDIESRSWLSKFLRGYSVKHTCWFGYGPLGIILYIDEERQRFVEKHEIMRIGSNLKDGSLIVLKFYSPKIQTIRLKFGGDSSALKFCENLKSLLIPKATFQ